jgi:hypothetical protein
MPSLQSGYEDYGHSTTGVAVGLALPHGIALLSSSKQEDQTF